MKTNNLRSVIFGAALFTGLLFLGSGPVEARMDYGSGYYVNLCDSGTAATYYNCDPGCDPRTGSCTSINNGVVKWVCLGKWNQCLESESQWTNYEQVDNVGCGYTVQLSLFDKKCRREDGSWDAGCRLLGYMVWYSGECWEAGTMVTPKPSPTKVPIATVTPTIKPKINPTAVIVSKFTNQAASSPAKLTPTPTAAPVVKMCGQKCQQAADCQAGFACIEAVCRNPGCPSDKTCFCQGGSASASAVSKMNPDTGVETWLGMAGMAALGALGMKLKRVAKKVWRGRS